MWYANAIYSFLAGYNHIRRYTASSGLRHSSFESEILQDVSLSSKLSRLHPSKPLLLTVNATSPALYECLWLTGIPGRESPAKPLVC